MKRIFKKMAAAVLALTMILSLSAGALATTTPSDPGGTSGSVRSTATNEGVAADVVKVLMPTLGPGAFDMYLDPNDLIKQSHAAETGKRFGEATVSSGTYVYFASRSYDEDEASYTNKSQRMDVFNKSNKNLLVEVSVEADKNNNNISFVDSLDKLKDSDGEWLAKPSMYLGISATPKGAEAASDTDVVKEANYGDLGISSNGARITNPVSANGNGSCGMLIDPVFTWAEDTIATETIKKDFSAAWTETTFKVMVESTGGSKTLSVLPSSGLSPKFDIATASSGNATRLQQTVVYSDGTKTYNAATLTYYFDQSVVEATANSQGTGITTEETFFVLPWSGNSEAEVSDTIATTEGAYSVKYVDSAGGVAAHYEYQENTELEVDSLQRTTFQLEAGINPVSAWDGLAGSSSAINVDVIWKVTAILNESEPVFDVLTYPAKTGATAVFEMISAGKSMHGALKAVYGVSYPDTNKTVTHVLGDADNVLTYDSTKNQYVLNCVTKVFAQGTADEPTLRVNYVYADGTTGSTLLPLKEST